MQLKREVTSVVVASCLTVLSMKWPPAVGTMAERFHMHVEKLSDPLTGAVRTHVTIAPTVAPPAPAPVFLVDGKPQPTA